MVVPVICALLILSGLTLAAVSLRGSFVDCTPRCRKCLFDVTHALGASDRCPECGLVLTTRRAFIPGTRRRRSWSAVAGILIAALGIAIPATPMLVRWAGIDVARHTPTWILERRAMPARWSFPAERALDELTRRAVTGTLSGAQINAVAERILRQQSDQSRMWVPGHGDLFLELVPRVTDPMQSHHRYLRQLAAFDVQTDVANFEDRPITIDLVVEAGRLGSADSWWVIASIESCAINGVEIELDENDPRPHNHSAGRWFLSWFDGAVRLPFSFWADGASGETTIELTWSIRAITGAASVRSARSMNAAVESGTKPEEIMPIDWEDLGAVEWTTSWKGTVMIDPPNPARQVGMDTSLPESTINACLRDVYVEASRNPDGVYVWIGGMFRDPPIDMAYDVWLDTSTGTHRLGRVGGIADESARFCFSSSIDTLKDPYVTVRFVPAADYADRRVHMRLIDGRELVRRSLAVQWLR